MGMLQAYQWAIQKCNADNVGYSQNYRNQQTHNGILYYDCSSFINYALNAGGFITPGYAPHQNAFTTYTMPSALTQLGFKKYPTNITWQNGDIMLRSTHTEMVYDGARRITMGAHGEHRPLKDQVSINSEPSSPGEWESLWRYDGDPVIPEWIKGNRYLTLDEMKNNAYIIYIKLSQKGWSYNSICAILGNVQSESTINPWIWEGLHEGVGGYGLVQWTPASKYKDWAGSSWKDPNRELDRIEYEAQNNIQWFKNPNAPTPNPPITFTEFKTSALNIETLANYFLWYYEHPAQTIQPNRAEQAKAWDAYFQGGTIPPLIRNVPLWLLFKFRR